MVLLLASPGPSESSYHPCLELVLLWLVVFIEMGVILWIVKAVVRLRGLRRGHLPMVAEFAFDPDLPGGSVVEVAVVPELLEELALQGLRVALTSLRIL